MAVKGRLRLLSLAARRAVNGWQVWPAGILPLPAQPASREFAFDRGIPIDRYFIERFLQQYSADIRGRVLEIGDRGYTLKFGGDRVARSDVLHAVKGNPEATIVGDLASGKGLARGAFDCLILTQTLHVIYDIHSAVENIHRLLKPGGIALLTVPGISQISRYDAERWGDYWRMTPLAVRRLLEEVFPAKNLTVAAYGNVRLAAAYLYGLAVEEIPASTLAEADPDYPLIVCARAKK
jgi:SAM-dependent methyltransferase